MASSEALTAIDSHINVAVVKYAISAILGLFSTGTASEDFLPNPGIGGII